MSPLNPLLWCYMPQSERKGHITLSAYRSSLLSGRRIAQSFGSDANRCSRIVVVVGSASGPLSAAVVGLRSALIVASVALGQFYLETYGADIQICAINALFYAKSYLCRNGLIYLLLQHTERIHGTTAWTDVED